jgi:hypothetical protein
VRLSRLTLRPGCSRPDAGVGFLGRASVELDFGGGDLGVVQVEG